MEREVAEKVAAMVAVMVVEVRVVARAAVMVEVVRVVVPAEVMVEAVMEVVPTKVNPRTTQKMMMSQVSTSSIYTDLFSTSRNHTMMHEPHAAGSPIHCTPSSSSLLCFF